MKDTAFLLSGRVNPSNINKNRCVLIKPCEKLSMQQASSNDANKAAMFLQLREKGCNKKQALIFSKKKYCKYDQTKQIDGPKSFRKLIPQKTKAFKTHYGWDLSGEVNFQVDDIKFYDIRKKSKKILKEQKEAQQLQKQALKVNLKNIDSIESQMKNLKTYFNKIDKKVKSCSDISSFQKKEWASQLVEKTKNEIQYNRKYVPLKVSDGETDRNIPLYELAKEVKVKPQKKKSIFTTNNIKLSQGYLIDKLQAFPDEVMDQIKVSCRYQDINELEKEKSLINNSFNSDTQSPKKSNRSQNLNFFGKMDEIKTDEEEEEDEFMKQQILKSKKFQQKYYLSFDKDKIINQNNQAIKNLTPQNQKKQQNNNIEQEQKQSILKTTSPRYSKNNQGILKNTLTKIKTQTNLNLNSQVQIKDELLLPNKKKSKIIMGQSMMARSSLAQSQLTKSFQNRKLTQNRISMNVSALNKSNKSNNNLNDDQINNRQKKPTLNLNFKTEVDDDSESQQMEVSLEIENEQNQNQQNPYLQINESPISKQQFKNQLNFNNLYKGIPTPKNKDINLNFKKLCEKQIEENEEQELEEQEIPHQNQFSKQQIIKKKKKQQEDNLKLIKEGGALDYDKKIGDPNLDKFNEQLKNWVNHQLNQGQSYNFQNKDFQDLNNNNNNNLENKKDPIYNNLISILDKQKQEKQQILNKHKQTFTKNEIIQRKSQVKEFYTKKQKSNPNLLNTSSSKLFQTQTPTSNRKLNDNTINYFDTQSTLNPEYYQKPVNSNQNLKSNLQIKSNRSIPNLNIQKQERKNVNFNIKENNLSSSRQQKFSLSNFSDISDNEDVMSENQFQQTFQIKQQPQRRELQRFISGAECQALKIQNSSRKYVKIQKK